LKTATWYRWANHFFGTLAESKREIRKLPLPSSFALLSSYVFPLPTELFKMFRSTGTDRGSNDMTRSGIKASSPKAMHRT